MVPRVGRMIPWQQGRDSEQISSFCAGYKLVLLSVHSSSCTGQGEGRGHSSAREFRLQNQSYSPALLCVPLSTLSGLYWPQFLICQSHTVLGRV